MNYTKIHWLLSVLIFPLISFADKPNVLLIAVDDLNADLGLNLHLGHRQQSVGHSVYQQTK